jgi:sec-independent protein translocase protein TatA
MPDLGAPELLIIALIAVLLFGPAKIADLGGALGRSIREFRAASRGDGSDDLDRPRGPFCARCGATGAASAKFCANCGAPRSAHG